MKNPWGDPYLIAAEAHKTLREGFVLLGEAEKCLKTAAKTCKDERTLKAIREAQDYVSRADSMVRGAGAQGDRAVHAYKKEVKIARESVAIFLARSSSVGVGVSLKTSWSL